MQKTRRALAAAGVAALAGGGTAVAAKGHTHTMRRPLTAAFRPAPGPPGLDAAATYLATTADALHTQLESGKTLAQIANATSGSRRPA